MKPTAFLLALNLDIAACAGSNGTMYLHNTTAPSIVRRAPQSAHGPFLRGNETSSYIARPTSTATPFYFNDTAGAEDDDMIIDTDAPFPESNRTLDIAAPYGSMAAKRSVGTAIPYETDAPIPTGTGMSFYLDSTAGAEDDMPIETDAPFPVLNSTLDAAPYGTMVAKRSIGTEITFTTEAPIPTGVVYIATGATTLSTLRAATGTGGIAFAARTPLPPPRHVARDIRPDEPVMMSGGSQVTVGVAAAWFLGMALVFYLDVLALGRDT